MCFLHNDFIFLLRELNVLAYQNNISQNYKQLGACVSLIQWLPANKNADVTDICGGHTGP